MRKYEDECVSCPPEMGCLGESCPYRNVPRDYCDTCDCEDATYRIDEDDYCKSCAEKYLQDMFDGLTIEEKAEILEADISKIHDYD